MAEGSEADFAVAVVRDEGRWEVAALPPRAAASLDSLVHALGQQPGEGGTIGLVSVGDDFFVALRVGAGDDVRLLISDATAAEDWKLAAEVLEALGEPMPEEADDGGPAGDLGIFADLGFDAFELEAICEDVERYPDEMLGSIAGRLGFAESFEDAVDAATGR